MAKRLALSLILSAVTMSTSCSLVANVGKSMETAAMTSPNPMTVPFVLVGGALSCLEPDKSSSPLEFETPLVKAIKEVNICVVKDLLAKGVKVNEKSCGETPLNYAVAKGNIEITRILLDYGADMKPTPNSPLMIAAGRNDIDMINFLLDRGADPNDIVDTKNNYTLLMVLARNQSNSISEKRAEIMVKLLAHGALVNAKTRKEGLTALMLASGAKDSWGHPKIVRVLCEEGANVNDRSNEGKTALLFATYKGNKEIVEVLLRYKADPNIKDGQGINSFDLAKKEKYYEIDKIFQQRLGGSINQE